MKNTFFVALLGVSLFFTSCEKSTISANADDNSGTVTGRRGADDPTPVPPSNLPASVQAAFSVRYPTATRMEWQAEDGNTWKVKFFIGSVRWKAFFRADGTFISASLA